MTNEINLNQAKEFILDLTSQAGTILRNYFISGQFTTKSKGGVDFLTQADKEVDTFLLESIRKQYPSCPILTEETAPDNYLSLKDAENLWVIDPLDGTVNFSRHHPHFAIFVGLVNHGLPQLGVVFAPIEGKLYWASIDQDRAFLNNQPIKVSPTNHLKTTVLACDWGWDLTSRMKTVKWLEFINDKVRQIKCLGSAVADLASLAAGDIDVYMHSGLKPWDIAASSLLIEKAGGKITTPTGEKWDLFNPEMLATNGILHEQMLKLINH